jgi:hypothetical protein
LIMFAGLFLCSNVRSSALRPWKVLDSISCRNSAISRSLASLPYF